MSNPNPLLEMRRAKIRRTFILVLGLAVVFLLAFVASMAYR